MRQQRTNNANSREENDSDDFDFVLKSNGNGKCTKRANKVLTRCQFSAVLREFCIMMVNDKTIIDRTVLLLVYNNATTLSHKDQSVRKSMTSRIFAGW